MRRTTQQQPRGLPNRAYCQTAHTAEEREVPNSAKCQTAANNANARRRIPRRRTPVAPRRGDSGEKDEGWTSTAARRYAHLGSCAVRRSLALRAVWQYAPFGSTRRLAVRAVRHLAPLLLRRLTPTRLLTRSSQSLPTHPDPARESRRRARASTPGAQGSSLRPCRGRRAAWR